jgi:hypothetical protein
LRSAIQEIQVIESCEGGFYFTELPINKAQLIDCFEIPYKEAGILIVEKLYNPSADKIRKLVENYLPEWDDPILIEPPSGFIETIEDYFDFDVYETKYDELDDFLQNEWLIRPQDYTFWIPRKVSYYQEPKTEERHKKFEETLEEDNKKFMETYEQLIQKKMEEISRRGPSIQKKLEEF